MMKYNRPWEKPWYVQRSEDNNPLRNDLGAIVKSTTINSNSSGSGFLQHAARFTLTALAALYMTACSTQATPTPTINPTNTPAPTRTYTPAPTPTETPKSTYELASEKLDYQTAQHWKGVVRNLNSEKAIDEIALLPQEGRLVLAEDIKAYAADSKISDKELSDLANPDGDVEKSSDEVKNGTNPMDPSNASQKISDKTFSFVRSLVEYNNSLNTGKSLPEIYTGLEKGIYIVELNPELTTDLTPSQNHIFSKLVGNIPEIAKYPKAMRLGAIQADSQNLADEYAIKEFVVPAIAYVVTLQDEGNISALNGLGIPDKALEEEGIRQILLPIELREVNIRAGARNIASLETGINNVTFDKSLGKSPQEWLGEMSRKDYENKNSLGYKRALANLGFGPGNVWENSYKIFLDRSKGLLSNGEDMFAFIRGYPIYLRTGANIVPGLTEQASPYYDVLLARGFGKAIFDVVAKYPSSARLTHSEPFILTSDASDKLLLPYRFGFWLEKQALIDDYFNKPNNVPHAEVRRSNGTYETINLSQNSTK